MRRKADIGDPLARLCKESATLKQEIEQTGALIDAASARRDSDALQELAIRASELQAQGHGLTARAHAIHAESIRKYGR